MIELEAQTAGQEREAQLVEAHALALGLDGELLVQGDGEAKKELSGGFHDTNSIASSIDIDSTARNTKSMSYFFNGEPVTIIENLPRGEVLVETSKGLRIFHKRGLSTHNPRPVALSAIRVNDPRKCAHAR